jgi:UDP-GlcNAc:undecaprenyl-phosphate GlcNAc-1-phosphate transferase
MTTTAWVVPLLVSGGVALAATPLARSVANRSGLVDRPARHKAHRRATPYLGGIAIAAAVIAGRLARSPTRLGAVTAALAVVIALVGLLDDDRYVPPRWRITIEAACAGGAVLAGLRITGAGVAWLDVAVTVLLLVGVTNAINLMDNLDGLAAGVTAAGAAGAGIIAALGGDGSTSVDAASLVGACLAFLVFNARPASIFMGDAGSLFLGFLLTAVAIRAGVGLPEPASLVVPLLILGLPIADTTTVVLARLRHDRSPFQGGRDHLSHRLAGTGMGAGPAVAVLIAVEGVMSGLAVVAARQVVPLGIVVAAGVVVLLVVLVVAGRVRVYSTDPVRLPRVLTWGAPFLVVLAGALTVPAALAMIRAHRPALAGEAALEDALAAARSGHLSALSADLARARQDFDRANRDLAGPLVTVGRAYPVLSSNLDAARTIVRAGLTISGLGTQLTSRGESLDLSVHDGTVPLQALAQAAPGLRAASRSISTSAQDVDHLSHTYLVSQIADAVDRLGRALGPAQQDLQVAAGTATYLPRLLGGDGPRRYFVAVQNPTEQRGTGGLIGNWGILDASNGHLHLERFARLEQLSPTGNSPRALRAPAAYLARYAIFDPAHDWQNVNMSPDFPTVGSVIVDLFPQAEGTRVDGVVAVDPAVLGALLSLTGPIQVPGWPEPISASTVEAVTLHDAYVAYADETQRANFLGAVAQDAFTAFSRLNLSNLSQFVSVLGPLLHQQDVQVYSTRPTEEAFVEQVGLAGAFPTVRSSALAITTQNVAANKIDYYLHRSLDYQVTLTPQATAGKAAESAQADVEATLALHNAAPASGLPPSIIGPYSAQFRAGEEATYLSLYSELTFGSATLNGAPTSLSSGTELGRNVYSTFIDVDSGKTATLGVSLTGRIPLLPGGWYELDLPHQPSVNPDQVAVVVAVPDGWRVTGVRGGTQSGPGTVRAIFTQSADRSVWVRVAPTGR